MTQPGRIFAFREKPGYRDWVVIDEYGLGGVVRSVSASVIISARVD